jgi:hypothetical protein
MPDNPQLLSPERLKQIATWAETPKGPRSGPAHVRDGEILEELLADRAAFRQMVAAELAALAVPPTYAEPEPGERTYAIHPDSLKELRAARQQANIERIRAAATRLGIDLSSPTS